MQLTFSTASKLALVVVFAIHFPIAGYLTYYAPTPEGQHRRPYLSGPFMKGGGFSYIAPLPQKLAESADSVHTPMQSQFQLFENEKPIGPPHSLHDDIANSGGGRYSHWRSNDDSVLIFSTSDNSDPNSNGRRYWYPKP
jgi:hypothetical protein